MAVANLTEEIVAFHSMLPEIRNKHGSAWAVVLDQTLRGAFRDFEAAAQFAVSNFPGRPFLIRHTDEQIETVPFVFIEE